MKRITSLVLALVLLMCFLPGVASAAELDIDTDGTLYEGYYKSVELSRNKDYYIFDFYPEETGYYHFGHTALGTVIMGTAGSDGYYLGYYAFDSVDGYTVWLEAGEHCYVTVEKYNPYTYEAFDLYAEYLAPKDTGWTECHGRDFYWVDGDLAYGWIQSGGKWYCVNEMGYIYTDTLLQDSDGNLFIVDEDGVMQTGWIEFYDQIYYTDRTYYAGADGVLRTGWQLIDGQWYAFHPDEAYMYRSTEAWVEGYWYAFDENGHYITGLYNGFYYADNGARAQECWAMIDGKWYYFGSNGLPYTHGIRSIDGWCYYFDDYGVMQTGWVKSPYDGYWYYFHSNGVAARGWTQLSGQWYYMDYTGRMMTGWIFDYDNGMWYYMNNNGAMVTGWQQIDGVWYYLNSEMKTGWQQIGGVWYFFNEDGAMQSGWQQIDGVWYYLNNHMQTGWQFVDGKWYYFNAAGAMQSGWQKISGNWYYLNNHMITGWLQQGGVWYYLGADGAMVTGTQVIDGVTYYFDASGAWIP